MSLGEAVSVPQIAFFMIKNIEFSWGACPPDLCKTCNFSTYPYLHIKYKPEHPRPCFLHSIFQNLKSLHWLSGTVEPGKGTRPR